MAISIEALDKLIAEKERASNLPPPLTVQEAPVPLSAATSITELDALIAEKEQSVSTSIAPSVAVPLTTGEDFKVDPAIGKGIEPARDELLACLSKPGVTTAQDFEKCFQGALSTKLKIPDLDLTPIQAPATLDEERPDSSLLPQGLKSTPDKARIATEVRDFLARASTDPHPDRPPEGFVFRPSKAAAAIEKIAKESPSPEFDLSDTAQSIGTGAIEAVGGALRGSADVYDTLVNTAANIIKTTTPEKYEDAVLTFLSTPLPWWLSPSEVLRRPGISVQELAEKADIPEDKKTFYTDVGKGLGQLGAQIATYLVNPAIGTTALFAQGAEEAARRAEKGGATAAEKDVAVSMGALVTGVTEKMGLDKLLNRIPPRIKNNILRRLTDIGLAGGIEAVQEVIESIGQNLIAVAVYDPDAEVFDGLVEEAQVAGTVGGIARALLTVALPRRKGGRPSEEVSEQAVPAPKEVGLEELEQLISRKAVDERSAFAQQAKQEIPSNIEDADSFSQGIDDALNGTVKAPDSFIDDYLAGVIVVKESEEGKALRTPEEVMQSLKEDVPSTVDDSKEYVLGLNGAVQGETALEDKSIDYLIGYAKVKESQQVQEGPPIGSKIVDDSSTLVVDPVQGEKKSTPGLPGTAPADTSIPVESPDLSKKHKFESKETEEKIRSLQEGIRDKKSLLSRANDFRKRTVIGFTRKFENIPNEPQFSPALETLRGYSEAFPNAMETTVRFLKSTTDGLNNRQFDDFTLMVQFNDFMYEVSENRDLTAGLTPTEVRAEHAKIKARVDADPQVQEALETRNAFIADIGSQLVRNGLISKEKLQNPNYFRHQVMEYARQERSVPGRTRQLKKPKSGSRIKREGTTKDINLNYLEAEFEYIAHSLADIKVAQSLKSLDARYGIKDQVKQTARDANVELVRALKPKLIEKDKERLSELLDNGATRGLDTFLKEKLGNKYKSWKTFVPEGYQIVPIDKGKVYITALTIGEQQVASIDDAAIQAMQIAGVPDAAIEIVTKTIKEQRVSIDTVQEIVLPDELASTVMDMPTATERKGIAKFLATTTSAWKVWILVNPSNVVQYNLNNFFSDMDAVVAGSPRALKKMGPAISELFRVMHGAEPSPEYLDAQESGVFASGFSVQEIADVSQLSHFAKRLNQKATDLPIKAVWKIWRFLKDYTRFRENWFRYAAYLSYREQLAKGQKPGYGGSVPKMVDALSKDKDKAALLTRDLVGDYGNISKWGNEIRETAIPFYSWMEVNTKRYTRLHVNAVRQLAKGIKDGDIPEALAGSVMTAYLMARMYAVYALGNLFNHLFFPEEEETLSKIDKVRPHLILGTTSDDEVRVLKFQGALIDYYSWWGFQDAGNAMSEMIQGKGTALEVATVMGKAATNRIISGLSPVIKSIMELPSGKSFWPDAFSPSAIPDSARHVAKMFALENPYDWVTGMPTKGPAENLLQALNPLSYSDPEYSAYNEIRSKAWKFKEKETENVWSPKPLTPKQNLVRLLKISLRLKDKEAEKSLRKQIRAEGITRAKMIKILKAMEPLASLSLTQETKFKRSLTKEERSQLRLARKYYRETYR